MPRDSALTPPSTRALPVRGRPTTFERRGLSGLALILLYGQVVGCQSWPRRDTAACGSLCEQAQAARDKGNSQEANRFIDEALRQRPQDVDTRLQLAETLWTSGRRAEAVEQVEQLRSENPKNAKLATRLATMRWETNHPVEAARAAQAAIDLDPQSKDAWHVKARCEAADGKLDQSLESYLQLLQIASDDVTVITELAELHLKRGNPDRACPLFRNAIQRAELTPEQRTEMEWLLGVAYARSQRWPLAINVMERALQRREATADDWCLLGWAHIQTGDIASAQLDLQRARERDPHSVAARKLAFQLESALGSHTARNVVQPASHTELP